MLVVRIKINQNSRGIEQVRLHDHLTGKVPVDVEEREVVYA